LNPHAYK